MLVLTAFFCFIIYQMDMTAAAYIDSAARISAEFVVMTVVGVGVEFYLVDVSSYSLLVLCFSGDGRKSVIVTFAVAAVLFYFNTANQFMDVSASVSVSFF